MNYELMDRIFRAAQAMQADFDKEITQKDIETENSMKRVGGILSILATTFNEGALVDGNNRKIYPQISIRRFDEEPGVTHSGGFTCSMSSQDITLVTKYLDVYRWSRNQLTDSFVKIPEEEISEEDLAKYIENMIIYVKSGEAARRIQANSNYCDM